MDFYTSLMQLLREENKLCEDIQTGINILDATKQMEEEGMDLSAHSEFIRRVGEETGKKLNLLHRKRAEIGGRLMMLESTFSRVTSDHLNRPGGDGDGE